MISVNILKNKGKYSKIELYGHAEFDDYGKDIVCAAVSALVVNCANSIENFTDDLILSETHEDGTTEILLKENISHDTELLIDSMLFGLKEINKTYGNKVLKISVKEV